LLFSSLVGPVGSDTLLVGGHYALPHFLHTPYGPYHWRGLPADGLDHETPITPKNPSALLEEFDAYFPTRESNKFAIEPERVKSDMRDWLRSALQTYGEYLIEEGIPRGEEFDDGDDWFLLYAESMKRLNEKV